MEHYTNPHGVDHYTGIVDDGLHLVLCGIQDFRDEPLVLSPSSGGPSDILTLHSYTEAIQAWRYISDRTGIICYATLPWLWLFSGRNNIFLWLTGWSFATFNIFHRHVARLATLLAIVHSIGWTAIEGNCTNYLIIVADSFADDSLQTAALHWTGKRSTGIWVGW